MTDLQRKINAVLQLYCTVLCVVCIELYSYFPLLTMYFATLLVPWPSACKFFAHLKHRSGSIFDMNTSVAGNADNSIQQETRATHRCFGTLLLDFFHEYKSRNGSKLSRSRHEFKVSKQYLLNGNKFRRDPCIALIVPSRGRCQSAHKSGPIFPR